LKKSWPEGAFHQPGKAIFFNPETVAIRIEVLCAGSKNLVHAQRLEQRQVIFEISGIAFEVPRIVELCGIDEDADDGNPVLPPAALDERDMSSVQGAHGGHKPDLPAIQ